MSILRAFSARLAVLTASALVGVACASRPTPVTSDTVPRTAGTLATTDACHVTGAWNLSGESVPPPSVTRCVLPRYPRALIAADQKGEIVYRIAVDSAGHPDTSSLRVIRTSAPALVRAAEAAAPYLQFASARSRPVVVVEMLYTFTLERP